MAKTKTQVKLSETSRQRHHFTALEKRVLNFAASIHAEHILAEGYRINLQESFAKGSFVGRKLTSSEKYNSGYLLSAANYLDLMRLHKEYGKNIPNKLLEQYGHGLANRILITFSAYQAEH